MKSIAAKRTADYADLMIAMNVDYPDDRSDIINLIGYPLSALLQFI
jgi:hypothetical protein